MKWLKFKNTFEEIQTFSCGTMLMLRDGTTIMLGDKQVIEYDIIYYSNELIVKIRQLKNPEIVQLKRRNIDVIKLLANGFVCKEIGVKMKISTRAVNEQVYRIRKTFGCKNIPQLVYTLTKSNVL